MWEMFIDRLYIRDKNERRVRICSRFPDWITGLVVVPLSKDTIVRKDFGSGNKTVSAVWVTLNLRFL